MQVTSRNAPALVVSASTPAATNVALEGAWTGREVTPGHEGSASLTFSGQNLEFHGANADDWAKGTFIVRDDTHPRQLIGVITDCPAADAIGKKSNAIYNLQDGTLTLTGFGPGIDGGPSAFDQAGARQFVFKRAQ